MSLLAGENGMVRQEHVMRSSAKAVLAVDVGGSSVKILATAQTERRSFLSGPKLTPGRMVAAVKKLSADWVYDVVSIGYPGPVASDRPIAEPYNLGRGWVGFDFGEAFGCPVKVINDAAMQALGSYNGGKMLFSDVKDVSEYLLISGAMPFQSPASLEFSPIKSFER